MPITPVGRMIYEVVRKCGLTNFALFKAFCTHKTMNINTKTYEKYLHVVTKVLYTTNQKNPVTSIWDECRLP
jgi:hypothetical protein